MLDKKFLICFLCLNIPLCLSKRIFQADDYYPLVRCQYGVYGKENFKGIELEIFREVFEHLGWKEDEDFMFECTLYSEMLNNVLNNNSVAGAFSAVVIDSNLINQGHLLSQPSMENGLSVLGKEKTYSFFFLQVWDVGAGLITIGVIPLFFALLTYFSENRTIKMTSYLFQYYCSFFYLSNNIKLNSIPSRLVQKFFWLSVLILVSLYTARLTSLVTEIRLGGIQTAEELTGKKVLVLDIYENYLLNYKAITKTFDGNLGTEDMQLMLARSDFEYLATDDIILEYISYRSCDFNLVSGLKNMVGFKFGMSYSRSLGLELINKIDQSILDVTKKKTYSQRVAEFFTEESLEGCVKDKMSSRDNYKIVDMKEMGYIYFAVVALALIVSVSGYFIVKCRGGTIDKGQAEVDLREVKNKEVTQGVSLLFSLYLRANQTKINDYSLRNFDDSKRRKFDMIKKKYLSKPLASEEENSLYREILNADRDSFHKYASQDITLQELVGVASRASRGFWGRRSQPSGERSSSAKVHPEKMPGRASLSRGQSFINRLSQVLPGNLFFHMQDVPARTKENLRDYMLDKHNRSVLDKSSWFAVQTSRFLKSFNGRLTNYATSFLKRASTKHKSNQSL